MNNTFQQFENSLTRQAEISMNQWTKELADINEKLMREPLQIINALNEKRNLCTPGFLMRRQIQRTFTGLLESAAEETKTIYTNLYISGNIAWPESLVHNLSSKLEKYVKANQNQIVKAKEWAKWLSDDQIPTKRELAVKLSFLLNMDDHTTTKFLLACGHEPLSIRNPLDCICLFCKLIRPQGDWKKVEEILAKYEENRPEFQGNVQGKTQSMGSSGMTHVIHNTLSELTCTNNPEAKPEDAQDRLIEYMYSINFEFTRTKEDSSVYLSGYSLQRRHNFLELTRYLAKLYPEYDGHGFYGGERRNSRNVNNSNYGMVKVKIKENGYPDMTDLSRAFIGAHGWEFTPPDELGLYSHGAQKKRHDNIPFNRNVYFVCKSYEKSNRLRAIERFLEHPDHAEVVERKDVLLMAYLFISAYSRNQDLDFRESLYCMADSKATTDQFSKNMRNIISQLDDVVNMWDEYEKISGYVNCINHFLQLFSFEPFYPPFLLDRFILFALVGEEIGTPFLTDDGLPENLTNGWLEEGYAQQLGL